MNKMMKWSLMLAGAMMIGAASAMAQGDGGPLIDALVKKGVLSSQEGEEIRADMTTDLASTPGGMLSWGSSAVKGVKIYGDARVRYQWDNTRTLQAGSDPVATQRNRYRTRVRLGAEYAFSDDWKAGVRLETADANDSTNINYDEYFDKTNNAVFIGLAYLEYESSSPALFGLGFADYLDARIGKHLHPFLLSDAWWDSDVNPQGLSEQVGWKNVGISGLSLTARGGQYVIFDATDSNTALAGNADTFLIVGQTEIKYEWNSTTSAAIAPMFFHETEQLTSTALSGENAQVVLGELNALLIPAEVNWTMWGQPFKAFGTYGVNFTGGARNDLLSTAKSSDGNQLFNVGLQVGKIKNKGSWQVSGEYRYIENGSYTPNLSDSDFALNMQNQQGVVVGAKYALSDNVGIGATWFHSNPIQDSFPVAAATNDSSNAQIDVLQVDLTWKF